MTIEHVVVLMMETRSFDFVLGYSEHPDARFEDSAARLIWATAPTMDSS